MGGGTGKDGGRWELRRTSVRQMYHGEQCRMVWGGFLVQLPTSMGSVDETIGVWSTARHGGPVAEARVNWCIGESGLDQKGSKLRAYMLAAGGGGKKKQGEVYEADRCQWQTKNKAGAGTDGRVLYQDFGHQYGT